MVKVLYVTSEAHPLIKTGGLGDVAGSLPPALQAMGCDVRLLLPAYRTALQNAGPTKVVADIRLPALTARLRLLESRLPGSNVTTWLVDYQPAFDRPGNPYLDPLGRPWDDNATRFALFARVAEAIALNLAGLSWRPDVVHCNDWQCGLLPPLLMGANNRPATVFTIHNLAYQGLFPPGTLATLGLSPSLWSPEALEFYGQLSFIKGGLVFADMLSTVSPTYAREIQLPDFGFGLDGLLRHRTSQLVGILNGIDDREWDPARDPHLAHTYDVDHLQNKSVNKRALQEAYGLTVNTGIPLIGMVGRLVQQKGIDLVLDALPHLFRQPIQLLVLGSGEARYEDALRRAAARYPGRMAAFVGYDEPTAHQIEAGSDIFLMPSRFEPCGLNQLYSLRYGTLPVVRRVGGLADTVVDASPVNLHAGTATGVVFDGDSVESLATAVSRALALYADSGIWQAITARGMRQDFSWRPSAQSYIDLYRVAQHVSRHG